jgi:hypothetical protein
MKWFVIILCVAFLFTALFIDIWKHYIPSEYRQNGGLGVVPILLAANIALGIYYNLSVWYKLTDKMYMGYDHNPDRGSNNISDQHYVDTALWHVCLCMATLQPMVP